MDICINATHLYKFNKYLNNKPTTLCIKYIILYKKEIFFCAEEIYYNPTAVNRNINGSIIIDSTKSNNQCDRDVRYTQRNSTRLLVACC